MKIVNKDIIDLEGDHDTDVDYDKINNKLILFDINYRIS
jgi:hypothetical protein